MRGREKEEEGEEVGRGKVKVGSGGGGGGEVGSGEGVRWTKNLERGGSFNYRPIGWRLALFPFTCFWAKSDPVSVSDGRRERERERPQGNSEWKNTLKQAVGYCSAAMRASTARGSFKTFTWCIPPDHWALLPSPPSQLARLRGVLPP